MGRLVAGLKVAGDTARQTEKLPKIAGLADRLVTAHSATVEWLTTVLAEEALGGPAALAATPLQRLAGTASRVVNLPGRYAADRVNRTVDSVQHSQPEAIAAIAKLQTAADVRAIMAYEEHHKNCRSVVSSAQTRVAALAKQAVGVS